jgi:hypothetical protein
LVGKLEKNEIVLYVENLMLNCWKMMWTQYADLNQMILKLNLPRYPYRLSSSGEVQGMKRRQFEVLVMRRLKRCVQYSVTLQLQFEVIIKKHSPTSSPTERKYSYRNLVNC